MSKELGKEKTEKILRGYAVSRKMKYIVIFLLVVLSLVVILNLDLVFRNSFAFPILVIVTGLIFFIIFFMNKKAPEQVVSGEEAVRILVNRLNDSYETRDKIHVSFGEATWEWFDDKRYKIGLIKYNVSFLFNAYSGIIETSRNGDIDRLTKNMNNNDLFKEIKKEQVKKEAIEKLADGVGAVI